MTSDCSSPYENLPPEAFWRSGVSESSPFSLRGIYAKKWEIPLGFRIATAGSCFAQHISRHLKGNGFDVLDLEPAPCDLPEELHSRFGFSMYSGRYGNIYTAQQLLQLAREAAGTFAPADIAWERNGRFFDALRPSVEPDGLDSPEEIRMHREHHLEKVRELFRSMDLFVFTLGLTETWLHRESGTVYPTAPGTIAGSFNKEVHEFRNVGVSDVIWAFNEFQKVARSLRGNRDFRVLLTVSPVPLTATASGNHVLQATTLSKAVLRAAAGQLAANQQLVDYFPSYEIITNQAARGTFYDANLRSVRSEGVETVMRVFFSEHQPADAPIPKKTQAKPSEDTETVAEAEEDVQCEDALLDAFRK